jgi:hypothetical protein
VSNAQLMCALRHVSVARRCLSLAASDLAVVRYRGALPMGDNADELSRELERVCELAQELEDCAANLGGVVSTRE